MTELKDPTTMTRAALIGQVTKLRKSLEEQRVYELTIHDSLEAALKKIGHLTSDVETLMRAVEQADAGKQRPLTVQTAVRAIDELGKAISGYSLHRVQVLASLFGGRVVVFQRTRPPDAPWQIKLAFWGRIVGVAGTLPKVRALF